MDPNMGFFGGPFILDRTQTPQIGAKNHLSLEQTMSLRRIAAQKVTEFRPVLGRHFFRNLKSNLDWECLSKEDGFLDQF